MLEAVTKTAALVSALAIVLLHFTFHRDITWLLRAAATLALIAGWIGARPGGRHVATFWIVLAIACPALLRVAAGREGPILDFVWMTGLTAWLSRSVTWTRWHVPLPHRAFAAAWALTLALAWPVLVARETAFDPALLRDAGAINSWGMLTAQQVVAWTTYVAWTHLLGLLWLDAMSRKFAAPAGAEEQHVPALPPVVHGFWAGTTVASLVGVYQGAFDLDAFNTAQWSGLGRATGTLLDANAFGICAALAGPTAMLALHFTRARPSTRLAAAVMVINLAGVWVSGSRTAAVCALVGAAAVAVALWRSSAAATRRTLPVAAAGAAVVLVVLAVAGGAIGPARRILDLPAREGPVLSTVFNRAPYGTTAMRIISDFPLWGVGVGHYQVISPDYWRQMADDPLPFDHAQNWWRHQATELGLVGGAMLAAWSLVVLWTVCRLRVRTADGATALVLRGLLLAIGASSVIQMPTQTPVVLLWFLLLLAWLLSLRLPDPAAQSPRPSTLPKAAMVLGAVLAVAYAGSHLVLARGALSVAARARATGRPYITGTYGLESFPDGTTFRWTGREAQVQLPARTRWAHIHLWAHHPDIARNPVQVTLESPCGRIFDARISDGDPVTFVAVLPEAAGELDATVRVSRTWRPADYGEGDARELGVGVSTDFVSEEAAAAQQPHFAVPACGR